MYFTRPIRHDGEIPHTVPPPPHLRLPRPWVLSLGTYNICDSQIPGLTQAIRAARIGSFNLMILTGTKNTDQAYCRNRMGYDVVCSQAITTAAGDRQGGVVLVFHD